MLLKVRKSLILAFCSRLFIFTRHRHNRPNVAWGYRTAHFFIPRGCAGAYQRTKSM